MLIVKSTYSLNSVAPDRLTTEVPETLPKLAKKAGWPSVALVDERTMAGAVKFLSTCAKEGVRGTVGVQASRLQARGGTMTVMLVPLTQSGLARLMGAAKGVALAKGLAAVLAALPRVEGPVDLVAFVMPGPGYVSVEGEAAALRAEFRARGANCAAGVVTMGSEEMRHAPQAECLAFARREIPVARLVQGTTKARLSGKLAEALVQFAGDCVKARDELPAKDRLPQAFDDTSIPDATALLGDGNQAAANARSVFERIEPMTASRRPDLPRRLGLAEGESADDVLRRKAREGLEAKIAAGRIDVPGEARARLEYELETMIKLRFSNYFLIMVEALGYARAHDIPVGPGRGSAAGSMVTYALGITNIDPLRHKLLFERFINPERISLPDIDSDFCPDRRDEVFQHLVSLYGDDHVAQIATYGSLKPKGAVRKAATLLKMQAAGNKAIAAMAGRKEDLEVKFEQLHRHEDAEIAEIGAMAKFLHGLASNSGVHAGGVILSDDPISDWAPLSEARTDDGLNVVQYDMKATEDAGFVKFDFLGLRTLTIIDHCLRALRERGIHVDIDAIATDEEPVYEMLRKGRTLTVFQLEGGPITRAGRDIGITCFEDIVALVALYRPGPMGNIPLYASRKHKRAPVEYLHPVLEPVLEDTFGIIIYQEQIMQMARDFAGYTMPEADELRRAIGKKNKADVEAQREPFVRKSVEMGRDQELAEQLFEFILPFAQYGFNRSHAAAYATVTYQTAYLKKKWPGTWYASCLTYEEDAEKAARIVTEAATTAAVTIVQPDVNASRRGYHFFVRKETEHCILLPLECVAGVGQAAAHEALAERERNGPFRSFVDFTRRVSSLNKSQIESLVWAGAFDSLSRHSPNVSRPHFADLAQAATIVSAQKRRETENQMGLFGAVEVDNVEDPPPRMPAMNPEAISNRQSVALQNILHHERRTIASSAWRRQLEPLPIITKAAQLARSVDCATMGILKKQNDRMVPQRDGSMRRVIQVTIEDEGGARQFDVSPDFVMGADILDAVDRCVRVTLGASQGFSFISGAPEVKDIRVFPDPLAEPREYPAIVVEQELDETLRARLREALREVAVRGHAMAHPEPGVRLSRPRKAEKKKSRATHVLVVPPSRTIEIFPLPSGVDGVDLRDVMDSVPSVASVLD